MAAAPHNVVITGVSTGIGRAVAEDLAARGYRVFGSVRTDGDATGFEAEFGPGSALRFDVRDKAAIDAAAEQVLAAIGDAGLAAIVNNAGIAVAGPLEDIPLDRLRDQLEVNLVGTLAVTQAFLPLLKGDRPGRIVNISSVSGLYSFPFMGPYSASKFGLEALNDSLRRELMVHGIDVISVEPGGIATPIWAKADAEAAKAIGAYDGTPYEEPLARIRHFSAKMETGGLPASRVAEIVHKAISARRPKVRYVISRSPMQDRMLRFIPTRLLDRMIARQLAMRRGRR